MRTTKQSQRDAEAGVDLAWIFSIASVLAFLDAFLRHEYDGLWLPAVMLPTSTAYLLSWYSRPRSRE